MKTGKLQSKPCVVKVADNRGSENSKEAEDDEDDKEEESEEDGDVDYEAMEVDDEDDEDDEEGGYEEAMDVDEDEDEWVTEDDDDPAATASKQATIAEFCTRGYERWMAKVGTLEAEIRHHEKVRDQALTKLTGEK